MITQHCDICGRQSFPGDSRRDRVVPTLELLPKEMLEMMLSDYRNHHLCWGCVGKLKEVISTFLKTRSSKW